MGHRREAVVDEEPEAHEPTVHVVIPEEGGPEIDLPQTDEEADDSSYTFSR
jgi:hypothetical protein